MKLFVVAALVSSVAAVAPAFADSDEDGEKVFRKCKACHQVGDDAKNRTGPVLNGIVGSPAGAVEGFKYSAPLAAAAEAGLVWDEENLEEWLADPSGFLKTYLDDSKARSKMSLKLKDDDEREAVITYLEGF